MVSSKLKRAVRCRKAIRDARRSACAAAVKVWRAGPSLSNWATIAAALVAGLTFYFGYLQFRETQEATRQTLNLQREGLDLDRESKAVELFVKYNEMMAEPGPSPPPRPAWAAGATQSPSPAKPGGEFSWQDNNALAIAEAIYKLRRDDEGWRATVGWMLSHHTDFLEKTGIDCGTYDEEFIELLKQQVPRVLCVKP
jgi:hypothetical protein